MEIIKLHAENIHHYLDGCMALQKHLVKPDEVIVAEQFIHTAEAENNHFLAVVEEEKVIGMGVLSKIVHPVASNGYVNNIVVDPNSRGKGYAKALMDALEQKAQAWGCTRVDLTCSRPEVQAMYEKLGYTKKDTNFYIKKL